nr:MAG TPA: hypothetical protein [Caudoviricetes sp.]
MYSKFFIFFHGIKSLPKITYHIYSLDSLTTVFFIFVKKGWWKIGKVKFKTNEIR